MTGLDVIVVTYNSGTWVDRLIPSIGADVRTIVVDNASTDDTVERLERYDVEVIANPENRWLTPAWNQALARSSSPYVVLLNPDCEVLTSGWADKVVAFLEEHPDVGVMGLRLMNEELVPQVDSRTFASRTWVLYNALNLAQISARLHVPVFQGRRNLYHSAVSDVPIVMGSCLVIRREMLDRLGGLDEGLPFYFEEDDLCLRARQAGWRVVVNPDVEVIHAGGQSQKTVFSETLRPVIRQSTDHFFLKHNGPVFGVLLRACHWIGDRLAAVDRRYRPLAR